jgi:hypothetical protein
MSLPKRYPDTFVQKIKEIRRNEKVSFAELGKRFGIPGSTIRNWCPDTVGNRWDSLIINNERRRKEIKNSETAIIPKSSSVTRDQAKFLAGMLYGCEGSKYPSSSGVANSDPTLVVTFVKLLRKGFELDENKFSLHLQIHTTHDYQKLRKYWSNLLQINEESFIKPTIKEPRGGKHRRNYLGTCTVKYRDYKIQLRLMGIFEKFTQQFSPQSDIFLI